MPPGTVPDIDRLVTAGWNRGLSDLLELTKVAAVISSQGGVVLRLFGGFDDQENGVNCITSAENYRPLSSVVEASLQE
jgi:hypothetical protein